MGRHDRAAAAQFRGQARARVTLRFAANLSILFPETPFLDRFERARLCGFEAVECWFPYAFTPDELHERLDGAGQKLIVINTAAGDEAAGDWGLAAIPGREDKFIRSVDQALVYVERLGVPFIHVMAGNVAGDRVEAERVYCLNLERAIERASGSAVTLLIEPLNPRDRPDYFLKHVDQAAELIDILASDRLRMLFDVYHVQIGEGDITRRLERHFDRIAHVQIAGVPDRCEPDAGELSLAHLLGVIERRGYTGHVGCEYRPRRSAEDGLGWMTPYRD